ncbi:MAG: TetR/AcrR family transcriptional regulator [Gammaproteobacteria bacterium]|jgi:TetR/AcrR family transcriptional regulator, acrAB operon repressor
MPRKPANQQGDTLKAIQDQAFELFGRYGYEGVSIGDIAKRSKLSKGALYWHFQGKEALFLDCLERLHAVFEHHIFVPMRAHAEPAQAIFALFQGLERFLADPLVQSGIAGYWLIPSTPETAEISTAQRRFEQDAVATVQAVLQRAQQVGMIQLGDDIDDMSRAIISLVEAVVLPLRHQTQEEVHRLLRVLARTLFRAYAAPELLKLTENF